VKPTDDGTAGSKKSVPTPLRATYVPRHPRTGPGSGVKPPDSVSGQMSVAAGPLGLAPQAQPPVGCRAPQRAQSWARSSRRFTCRHLPFPNSPYPRLGHTGNSTGDRVRGSYRATSRTLRPLNAESYRRKMVLTPGAFAGMRYRVRR
jgi:hypothetical protein